MSSADKLRKVPMTIVYRRINHVTLAVPAGRAREGDEHFTVACLAFTEVKRPEALGVVYDIIWFQWLDILIHIDFTPPWTKPAENRHIAVEVSDLQAVRSFLEEKGAEIREAVVIPDRDRFYVLDPFGNYFEFIEVKRS